MTTPSPEQLQTQALEYVKQGQEAITSMFSAFSENISSMVSGGPSGAAGAFGALPRPAEAVDQMFDLGVQVLEAQRALAHGMLEAAGPALRAAESAVDSAASTVSHVDRARTR